jgi:hypothetical protein
MVPTVMARAAADHKADTVSFRIDPALKAELAKLARQDRKSLGELLRELARERVQLERWRKFEAEARRQSLEIAERSRDPESDEAEVMRFIAPTHKGRKADWPAQLDGATEREHGAGAIPGSCLNTPAAHRAPSSHSRSAVFMIAGNPRQHRCQIVARDRILMREEHRAAYALQPALAPPNLGAVPPIRV